MPEIESRAPRWKGIDFDHGRGKWDGDYSQDNINRTTRHKDMSDEMSQIASSKSSGFGTETHLDSSRLYSSTISAPHSHEPYHNSHIPHPRHLRRKANFVSLRSAMPEYHAVGSAGTVCGLMTGLICRAFSPASSSNMSLREAVMDREFEHFVAVVKHMTAGTSTVPASSPDSQAAPRIGDASPITYSHLAKPRNSSPTPGTRMMDTTASIRRTASKDIHRYLGIGEVQRGSALPSMGISVASGRHLVFMHGSLADSRLDMPILHPPQVWRGKRESIKSCDRLTMNERVWRRARTILCS